MLQMTGTIFSWTSRTALARRARSALSASRRTPLDILVMRDYATCAAEDSADFLARRCERAVEQEATSQGYALWKTLLEGSFLPPQRTFD
jgi:hypothetical protein